MVNWFKFQNLIKQFLMNFLFTKIYVVIVNLIFFKVKFFNSVSEMLLDC